MSIIILDEQQTEASPNSMSRQNIQNALRARQVTPGRHFHALASRLLSLRSDSNEHKTIGITSCSHGEGTSTVASNLAVAINNAISGEVLLVDCVEPRQTLSKKTINPGWIDLVFRDADLPDVVRPTDVPRLNVIGSGLPLERGAGTYGREQLLNVVQLLKERFEFVFFDLPCGDEMTGCIPIASVLDGVLLNVKAGKISSLKAGRLQRELQVHNANVLGVVLNQTHSYVPGFLKSLIGMESTSQ